MITPDELRRIAALSNLSAGEAEAETLSAQIEDMARLASGILPCEPCDCAGVDVLRDDVARPSHTTAQDILRGRGKDGYFVAGDGWT